MFPPEEAGYVFPAPSAKKSAPYDSNPAEAGPGSRAMDSLSPCAPPLFKGLKYYSFFNMTTALLGPAPIAWAKPILAPGTCLGPASSRICL